MKVIVISGHAQNGKDTVAGMMSTQLTERKYRVLVAHFADLLKYICKTFFGWDGKKDEHGRQFIQYVGTDVIKKAEPDFWVSFISSILKYFENNWDWVIIPDARFPNEIDKLIKDGFDVTHLRVVRGNFDSPLTPEQQRHPSEAALDDVTPDYYINNDGSLGELAVKVTNLVKEIVNEY